mmetsp:Transcript_5513/g.17126  ORF Transcript_5513/g.17126 Transcript_5513/m.17126 type:complete len:287 (+) Transcript_5513:288-1148(+)
MPFEANQAKFSFASRSVSLIFSRTRGSHGGGLSTRKAARRRANTESASRNPESALVVITSGSNRLSLCIYPTPLLKRRHQTRTSDEKLCEVSMYIFPSNGKLDTSSSIDASDRPLQFFRLIILKSRHLAATHKIPTSVNRSHSSRSRTRSEGGRSRREVSSTSQEVSLSCSNDLKLGPIFFSDLSVRSSQATRFSLFRSEQVDMSTSMQSSVMSDSGVSRQSNDGDAAIATFMDAVATLEDISRRFKLQIVAMCSTAGPVMPSLSDTYRCVKFPWSPNGQIEASVI